MLVGLWPLTNYKQALRLNNEVPGIVIPDATLKEMESAGDAARAQVSCSPEKCSIGRERPAVKELRAPT